ncbi:MAG: hypothetical protein HZC41_24690 [Chloroflexi bacterium]|nr:hypothetical protein [Chloroflexota bacterium]
MSKKLLLVVLALVLTGVFAVTVVAQDAPSITVSDQVSSGSVVIDRVVSDGPGWVVVRGAGGRGTPGPVMGQTSIPAGVSENVVVNLNLDLATRQLFAALHTDDTNEGTWDFGLEAGADAPVEADGEPVQQLFTAYIVDMADQPVAEDNTVFADTVVMNEAGWLVIHSDNNGQPGPVLGFAPVRAGRNADVTVEIDSEGRTDVLWPMLHVDTGAAGEYEFGTVEGADTPVSVNGEVATFPIWTVPHVRMSEQTVGADDAGTPTVFVESVLSSGPGFIVIHSDNNGQPGPVLGFAPVTDGTNTDITVTLDQGVALTPVVWPMLHEDTGAEGEYEFGTVEGADGPVRDAEGNVITFAVNLSGVEGAAVPQTTPETGAEATAEATAAAGDSSAAGGAATGACAIAARSEQGANIRSAPSMDSEVVGALSGSQSRSPLGITTQDANGFRWYQLSGNTWVRADVVTTSGACDRLPTASAEATPEATAGA